MVHYELLTISIDALGLAEVILNMVAWHQGLPNWIMFDGGLLFTSKFWPLLYYFFNIKRQLSTNFHP